MAIDRTGISSLDTGASDITYTGDQGPKSPAVKEMEMAGMMDEISVAFEIEHGYDISLANPEMRENFIQKWKEENFYDRSRAPVQGRDGIQMSSADPMLEEEYNKYVFEMQEMGQEPMSFEQFKQQAVAGMAEGGIARLGYKDGYSVQGGVKNYLGDQETVNNVPVKWQSGPDKPETELAYITKAEKDLILKKDIHGSLQDGPNMGPGGLMSLDSWGDVAGGQAGADVSDSGGGGRDPSPSTTYSYDPVAAAQAQAAKAKRDMQAQIAAAEAAKEQTYAEKAAEAWENKTVVGDNIVDTKTGEIQKDITDFDNMSGVTSLGTGMPQRPPGGGDPDMYWIGDTGGADITVPGDEQYQTISSKPIGDYEDDRILRISEGVEPGYRAQDERPFGLSKEEAFRQGKITEDQYKYSDPVLTLDRGLDTGTT